MRSSPTLPGARSSGFCSSDGAGRPSRHTSAKYEPDVHNWQKLDTGARGGVRIRSDGDFWKLCNSHQAVLTRERERAVAALGLSYAENPVMAGVVDGDGAPAVAVEAAVELGWERYAEAVVRAAHQTLAEVAAL